MSWTGGVLSWSQRKAQGLEFFKPFATREVEKQVFTPGQYDRANWLFAGEVVTRQVFEPTEVMPTRPVRPARQVTKEVEGELPEVCLVGKSNVGKSSLINSLLGSKSGNQIAYVSKTPGRTQSINFLKVRNLFHLVDMPGYGFAQVSRKHKRRLNVLIESYVKARTYTTLKLVCVLIDCRRGLSDEDTQLMSFLDDTYHPFIIVLTKIDKLEPSKLTDMLKDLEEKAQSHPYCYPEVLVTSVVAALGLDRLRALIATAMEVIHPGE